MNIRNSQVILFVLVALSISLNVLQFKGYASREEQRDDSFIKESLLRLSISRTILVDSENPLSIESRKLLHGQVLMDLTRIRPNIGELSTTYQQRYQKILADLDNTRLRKPDLFARDNMVMDDGMYSRYIEWISAGYTPE